jgi:chemotaxis family two-component system response regulator Rcp1
MNDKLKIKDKVIEVLLVEDNPGDVSLIQEVFKESKLFIRFHIARNGEDALAFLRREGIFSDAPTPGLILLDLGLPKKDGREVLAEIKEDPALSPIPVLILTGSQNDSDVRMVYHSNADFYITKAMWGEHFSSLLRTVEDFLTKSLEDRNPEKKSIGCHVVIKPGEKRKNAVGDESGANFPAGRSLEESFFSVEGKTNPLKDMERNLILNALEKNEGNRLKAARALGIGLATLYRKLKIYRKRGLENGRAAEKLETIAERGITGKSTAS